MRRGWALLALALTLPAHADWAFEHYEAVSGAPQAGRFAHLESAGRRNLAVSGGRVAVVWEENRDGSPQVYAALRALDQPGFDAPIRLSSGSEAYEPVLAGLDDGRFVAAFEQDGKVVARIFSASTEGAAITLDQAESAQVTLAADGARLHAAWGRREGRFLRLVDAPLQVTGEQLTVGAVRRVDPTPLENDQLYASLVITAHGLVVAWEDRRAGHTRLMTAVAATGAGWSTPRPLNEIGRGGVARAQNLGRGPGVTRVSLAGDGADSVAAVWMDKRDFLSGYDIYAGLSRDGGVSFAPNEKAQDSFGDAKPQWHPAVAVTPHGVVAAWDDPRDDSPDIWLSTRSADGEWSDDVTLDGASGPGAQEHPALLWAGGRLHLAWLQRDAQGTQIRYAQALWK